MSETKNKRRQYSNLEVLEIKKAIMHGIDSAVFETGNYNADQMKQIRLGAEHGISTYVYLNDEYKADQMEQIRMGQEHGIDVRSYLNPTYNADQMKQVRMGIEQGLDVSQYASLDMNADQMKEIRIGQKLGIDVSAYNHAEMSAKQMQEIRHTIMTKNILDRLKEQIKDILDHFLGIAKLYITYPEQMSEHDMDSKVKDVLDTRLSSIIEQKIQEYEKNKEPENHEEIVKFVSGEMAKEETQEQILSEPVLNEMEEYVQEVLETYAEQEEELRMLREQMQQQQNEPGRDVSMEEYAQEALETYAEREEELRMLREQGQMTSPETNKVAEPEKTGAEQTGTKKENITYHENPALNLAMANYVRFREEIGKPLLNSQISATLQYVGNMEADPERQAQILTQSVVNGWKALYPLKENENTNVQKQEHTNEHTPVHDQKRLEPGTALRSKEATLDKNSELLRTDEQLETLNQDIEADVEIEPAMD